MSIFEKQSFFGRLSKKIGDILMFRPTPDEEMIDELEEELIVSDLGIDTTLRITERLRDDIRHERLADAESVKVKIKSIVAEMSLRVL